MKGGPVEGEADGEMEPGGCCVEGFVCCGRRPRRWKYVIQGREHNRFSAGAIRGIDRPEAACAKLIRKGQRARR